MRSYRVVTADGEVIDGAEVNFESALDAIEWAEAIAQSQAAETSLEGRDDAGAWRRLRKLGETER